jgi:hypothetical protein
MKFISTVLLSALASATAKKSVELPSTLAANSKLGKKILSEARRLENADDEIDLSWVVDYSIKFQGCHHITQWNDEADDGEDVRIATKRLVRFRLCPAAYCDSDSSGGCDSGYGDYIVDMNTYLQAYLMDLEELHEWTCEYYQMKVCGCDDDDGKDDGFDEQECLNDCYGNNGLDYCIEEENDDDAVEFELDQYIECGQFDAGGRRRRRLDGAEVEYFLGPYCSDQGSEVVLGMFTDDTCSQFADDYGGVQTYKGFTGDTLPYSSDSIVGMECVPCEPLAEIEEDDGNANQNDAAEVEIKEVCEQLYQTAGKCENNLNIDDPNKNACNYMEGIKISRSDGVITRSSSGSKTTATFIGLFAVTSCLLAGYAYYLKSKLG